MSKYLIKPKFLKTTDITTSFVLGGVCAIIGGPIGITLAVGTTVGQLVYMHHRYKKDVEYANTVNPLMVDLAKWVSDQRAKGKM